MILIKEIIDYIDQNITNYTDYIYLNINYMKRAVKSIYIDNDKIIFESNFTSKYKFLSAEQILDQLYNIKNIKLPIWLKISTMFKPLNFVHIKKDKVNLYFDFDPKIDIDPIIDEKDINEDIENDINEDKDNIDEKDEEIGSDEFD